MPDRTTGFLNIDEPLPFEHLFIPFVLDAREELCRRVIAAVYGLLTPQAHAGWESYLLNRLVAAGAKAAHWQFQVFKTVRIAFPKERDATPGGADFLYLEFVGGRDAAARRQKLFSEFPALAGLCDVLIKNWLLTVIEFLERLYADLNDLSSHLMVGQFTCPIIALQAGLSDPHRGGRCVVRMHFENGASLIYKPRSLAPEAHFSGLLDWTNSLGITHRLRSAKCWHRGEYGWMENIEQGPCRDLGDVHAFYWRAGALLGLVHLAHGVDFHRENLIAAGGHPVLIDLETLWHPQDFPGTAAAIGVASVLRTGFLPQGNPQVGAVYRWGGLSLESTSGGSALGWNRTNLDDMNWGMAKREKKCVQHLPTLEGKAYHAPAFATDIHSGFQWVGGQMLKSNHLCPFRQWLGGLKECPRRLVLRSTRWYHAARSRLVSPASLRDGWPNLAWRSEYALNVRPEGEGERRALEEFDIPYFNQRDCDALGGGNGREQLPSSEEYAAQTTIIMESLREVAAADSDRNQC